VAQAVEHLLVSTKPWVQTPIPSPSQKMCNECSNISGVYNETVGWIWLKFALGWVMPFVWDTWYIQSFLLLQSFDVISCPHR
jgi:hypothetical protein